MSEAEKSQYKNQESKLYRTFRARAHSNELGKLNNSPVASLFPHVVHNIVSTCCVILWAHLCRVFICFQTAWVRTLRAHIHMSMMMAPCLTCEWHLRLRSICLSLCHFHLAHVHVPMAATVNTGKVDAKINYQCRKQVWGPRPVNHKDRT